MAAWIASLAIATYVSMNVESPLPPFQTYLSLAGGATVLLAILDRTVITHG